MREKKFTRKRHYGFFEKSTCGMISVPCDQHMQIGSAACKGSCGYFCGHSKEDQYVLCGKKPELLEALEKARGDIAGLLDDLHGHKIEDYDGYNYMEAAIKKAYGETE